MGEEERLLFLQLIEARRDVILSRLANARVLPRKAQAWEAIRESLPAGGGRNGAAKDRQTVKEKLGQHERKVSISTFSSREIL